MRNNKWFQRLVTCITLLIVATSHTECLTLSNYTELALLDIDTIEVLTVTGTDVQEITGSPFENLTQLNKLVIENNTLLDTISPDAFQGLVKLKHLHILSNMQLVSFGRIHSDALISLETIKIIKNGKLQLLPSDLLESALNLIEFVLCTSLVQALPLIHQCTKLRSVNICSNRITAMPHDYFDGLRITSLSLVGNRLTAIPNLLNVSKTLTILNLNSNPFAKYEMGCLDNFPKLQLLSLHNAWHFKLSDLTHATSGLPSLMYLNVAYSYKEQSVISDSTLKLFPKLKKFVGTGNTLTTFPNFHLTRNLEIIDLIKTKVRYLHGHELLGLDHLNKLAISTYLTTFPNLFHVKHLKILYLSENRELEQLPLEALSIVRELRELYLTRTSQTRFPCIACVRHSLKKINLERNFLTVIDENLLVDDNLCSCWPKSNSIRNSVEELYLGNNMLKTIEDSVMSLFSKLVYLHVQYNSLTRAPHVQHLTESLWDLNLAHNNLREIPANYFDAMARLVLVDLSYNLLSEFPIFYVASKYIQSLNLCHNRLTHLRNESLNRLLGLKSLDLSFNRISTFEFHYRPTNLRSLNIKSNQIHRLDSTFPKGQQVLDVYASNNPIICSKEVICWIKAEDVNIRSAVFHLNSVRCVRPARFVGVPWKKISTRQACADKNVLADEYICPSPVGDIGDCPSFDAVNNVCEAPCCRQGNYGGSCQRRIARVFIQEADSESCFSFSEKLVSVTHVGNIATMTAVNAEACAQACHLKHDPCVGFMYRRSGEGHTCTILAEATFYIL